MPKKIFCAILALVTLISLTVLSSCNNRNVVEDNTSVASADADNPSSLDYTEEEKQNNPESQTETQTGTQTETQTETQTGTQTGNQTGDRQPSVSSSTASSNGTNKPAAPTASSFTKQSLKATNGASLSYWLYTPENATNNMPLLVYLHGGSGKGDDLDILLQNGFPKLLSEGSLGKIPAYIVIPQLSTGMKGWTDIENSVRDLVYFCCKTYGTDSRRVSLTGHSMGGTGTWNLAAAYPSLFSCIAPMSGSITTSDTNISALSGIPVWAFVGSADKIVKPDSSIQFISALKKVNRNAQITIFDGADHFDVPGLAFQNDAISIVQWLITQSK